MYFSFYFLSPVWEIRQVIPLFYNHYNYIALDVQFMLPESNLIMLTSIIFPMFTMWDDASEIGESFSTYSMVQGIHDEKQL